MIADDDVSTEKGPHEEKDATHSGLERLVAELQAQTSILRATIDGIADAVIVADENGHFTHNNAAAAPFLSFGGSTNISVDWKYSPGVFRSDGVTPYPPDEMPLARALRGQSVDGEEMFLRTQNMPEGTWLHTSARPIYTQNDTFRGAVVVFRDVSERKQWEWEMHQQLVREKEKNEQLERMRAAIEQLSTPILEVWDEVLAVPIVGVVDSTRAADMMARVLEAVEQKQCRFLIVDITGVDVIDTGTANRLLQLVTAVEILGARCLLTGVRAVVAQTLVSLGMDLRGLTTLRTLRHGLSECIRAMEQSARQPMRELVPRTAQSRA